jgi:tetratricopeptide (TPR) repeat protein
LLAKGESVKGEEWEKQREAARYVNDGNRQCNAKSYADAIEQYKKAIAACPNYVMAYFGLGFVYWQQDRYTEAKEQFLKANKLDFYFGDVHYYLGLVNYFTARKVKGKNTYNGDKNFKWATLYGCDQLGKAYYYLAKVTTTYNTWKGNNLMDESKVKLELLRKSVAADPTNAKVWHDLGKWANPSGREGGKGPDFSFTLEQCAESISSFEKAIALKPDYAEAWKELSAIYHLAKHKNKSEECAMKAKSIGYKNPEAFGELRLANWWETNYMYV